MKHRHVGTLAAALTALPAGSALASGFMSARFGGEHGHPTTENPSAMYYNPAGLALGDGTRLYLDGTFAYISAGYDRDPGAPDPQLKGDQCDLMVEGTCGAGTPTNDIDRNSGENSALNFAAAPMLAVVSDFGIDNLGVGLGMYVPFGGASKWDQVSKFEGDTQYPGAVDGSQRWWSIEGSLRSLYVTGAGAWRFPGIGLSVGGGANLVMSSVHTLRARVGDGSDTLVTRTAAGEKLAEGRSRVEVKSMNFSLSGGLVWEPMENLWIGASYQSQPGFGKIQLDGDLEAVLAEQAEASTTKVRLEQELPDVIRLGGRWRPTSSTEVRLNGEFVRWSVFERQCLINMDDPEATDRPTTKDCRLNGDGELMEDRTIVGGDFDGQPLKSNVTQNIERDWEDTLAVRAGGSYWLQENLELYGALGYDGNAVPDERLDPAIPDFHDISLSAGARVELMEKALALAGTYTQFIYFAREIDVRDQANKPIFPSATPDAAGKYTRSIGALNVNVEYTF